MIATQIDAWRAATVACCATLEAQAAAMVQMRTQAHAQWRAGLAFWAGMNPMFAPVAALAEAWDPEVPVVARASVCGPVPMAPRRRAPPRGKTAA